MLLPTTYFEPDVRAGSFGTDAVQQLAADYEASLEAVARRFVDAWPQPALLVMLEVANKPSDRRDPNAVPKLRVKYSHPSGNWPYVPRHKSANDDSILAEACDIGHAEGRSDLDGLVTTAPSNVELSALGCPFIDEHGVIHERVLALYRQV